MITFYCKIRSLNKTVTKKLVESVSQSESCGFGTILDVLRGFFFLCVSVTEHWILLREHYCKKKN